MECRERCGACCIAPSITSPLPGMPGGKPAGIRCVNLGDDLNCTLFGDPRRPDFCISLKPAAQMCGENREQAMVYLATLEDLTR